MRLLVLALATVASAAPPSIRFEANLGQTDQRAQFVARSSRYNIFLTTTGAVLAPRNSAEGLRIRFVDSRPGKLAGVDPLPGTVNYFRGSTQAIGSVPTYPHVRQPGIYPGIDAVYHGEEGQLEYDFLVAPGADPSRIILAFDGARHVQLNDLGEIELLTAVGTLTQHKPIVYQDRDGRRISVEGHYEPRGNGQFALVVGKYDRAKPLVIDPSLVLYTSIGGSGPDQVNGLALDSQGNIYIAGQTQSLNFPIVGGVQGQLGAAFAYRLDATGSTPTSLNGVLSSITSIATDPNAPSTIYAGTLNGLLKSTDSGTTWATLAGGLPANSIFYPIVIDPSNSQIVYVVAVNGPGVYKSTDAGATWTAINNGLSIVGGSYFQPSGSALVIDPIQTNHLFLRTETGGEFQTTNGGAQWLPYPFPYNNIAFDPNNKGVVYASPPFADMPAIYKSTDGGVTFNPISILPGDIAAMALLVDPHNSSTLYASSSPGLFKSTDGGVSWTSLNVLSNLIVFQLMADPVQPNTFYGLAYGGLYKTTDGGATFSQVAPGLAIQSFAISSNGTNVYLSTTAANNVFVTKLDPTGKTILYSTYVGGSVSDQATGVALDAQDNLYVTGFTQSPDFPVTTGALKSGGGGPGYVATPGFVFKLNPSGNQLVYSATIDRTNPSAIAIDPEGNAYVTGWSAGGLAVTKTAYWTTPPACIATGFIGCIAQADEFVLKLNPAGSALIYATYLNQLFLAGSFGQVGKAIALDSNGNAYVTGLSQYVDKLSADGSALLYANALTSVGGAIALDSANNAYITGPGALVAKFDPNGAPLFSKTISTNGYASGVAIALDPAGDIVIAGQTPSANFPLFSPTQGMFAAPTGFLTKLDSSAAHLLFSTYVGDSQDFLLTGMALDSNGRAIICGSTFSGAYDLPTSFFDAFVSEYDMSDIPSVRLDNMLNAASLQGGPVSVGEIVTVQGAGFGTAANTQLLFDQMPATLLSANSTRLTAIVPYALNGKTFTQVQVQSGGALSNPVWFVVAPTSPGIYTADGSGIGQALAYNHDGTRNSLSNPAAVGSKITFYATGVGQTLPPGVDGVPDRSAPAAPINTVAIFIASQYISGPQYNVGPGPGFPADVFTVEAVVPNPTGVSLPGLVPVQILIGGVTSQGSSAVEIAIKQN